METKKGREKKAAPLVGGGGGQCVEFFSDKVPMDLRRRRINKSKKGEKNIKGEGEKRFVTNLATKG